MNNNILQPVTDTKAFSGRKGFVSKIYSRIGAGRPQSVSIVGDYKIGKTSLVNFLTAQQVKSAYLNNDSEYIYISISISEKNINTLDAFVEVITDEICSITKIKPDKNISYYDWFKKAAELLTLKKKKIIFFFDDFNLITQNEKFPLEFFSFLRSMANNYNVAYVTTSYHDLQKLCVSKDVEESPFFNIFTNMTLKALDKSEAQELLTQLSPKLTYIEKELILKYCGGFPYQIKVAFNILETSGRERINEFDTIFYNGIKAYYEKLFNSFDKNYQKILKRFIATGKVPDQLRFLFNDLERKDYVYYNENKPYVFSDIFVRFIEEKFDLKSKIKSTNKTLLQRILNIFKNKKPGIA